ncbi:hypothetical protein LX32DRAFT_457800 [Colletotrichum zoysiae]|uniref:Uncharacterized protein n=1 Tax=Colletotrichum zoysiae TaxID=1216348 RepID=A0AAD9LZR8_9PEZI|nr:hypothetical protein LX32DRAFT_457800 [Colletotrichum zoysiae]
MSSVRSSRPKRADGRYRPKYAWLLQGQVPCMNGTCVNGHRCVCVCVWQDMSVHRQGLGAHVYSYSKRPHAPRVGVRASGCH